MKKLSNEYTHKIPEELYWSQRTKMFAPHPDDEKFCCSGVIAKKICELREVLVVVMTDGRNALSAVFSIKRDPTHDQLKKIWADELMNATKIIGVPNKNVYLERALRYIS